jgi:anti-sigma regulatory factor (Ser/Thr protein kinase)
VPVAREFVRRALAAWDCDDVDEVASLLTTEVVGNAVRYAADQIALRVSLEDHTFRVEVRDTNPTLPERRQPRHDMTSGRGLQVVEALAARWGSQREAAGKTVWFELPVGGFHDGGPQGNPF